VAKPPPKRGTTKAQRHAAAMRKAGVEVSWMDPVLPKEGAAPRFGVNPAGGGKTKAQIDRERASKTPRFGIEPAGGGKTKAQVAREASNKAQKQAAYDDHVENLRKLGAMPDDAPDKAYEDSRWGPKYENKDLGWQPADGTRYNESPHSAPSKEELAAEREIVDAKEKAQEKAARQASTKRTRAEKARSEAASKSSTKVPVRRPSPAPAVTPAAPKAKAPDRATNVRNSKALPKPDKTLYTAPRTYTKAAEAPRAAGRSPAPKPKVTYKRIIKGAAKALGPVGAVVSLAMGADIAEAAGFQVDQAGAPDRNPRDRKKNYQRKDGTAFVRYSKDHPKERLRDLAQLKKIEKAKQVAKSEENARRSGSQFRGGTFNVTAGSKAPVRKKK